jgi:hypothetical protein
MCVRGERKFMQKMIMAGNALLIPANLSNYFLIRRLGVSEGIGDGVTGLLFGAAIGCFILGLRQRNS